MVPITICATRFISRLFVSGVVLLLASATSVSAQPAETLVVFGTSLSDPGNAFALVGGTNTPPDYLNDAFLVPTAPYTRGGHHFTDGPTWIEQLARTLKASVNAEPAFKGSNRRAMNFAVGAARARETGVNANLPLQVATFLQTTGGVASPEALYVIEIGTNDVRDALSAGPGGAAILAAAVASVRANVDALYAAGARRFLIWNVPNPAFTPAIRSLNNALVSAAAAALAISYNAGLDGHVAVLRATRPGIDIDVLDVFQLLNTVVGNPAMFGFTNVTTPCITPSEAPFFCQQPDQYLFWDGVHPTAAMHAVVSALAEMTLALP
jgi:phospholipase/lecithinase/hemolysin